MKKNCGLILCALFSALFYGCSDSSSSSVEIDKRLLAAIGVQSSDFIYVSGNSVTVPAANAGKEAYLITYNAADPDTTTGISLSTSGSTNADAVYVPENETAVNGNECKVVHASFKNENVTPVMDNSRSTVTHGSDNVDYDSMANGTENYFYVCSNMKNVRDCTQYNFKKMCEGSYCNVWYHKDDEKTFIKLTDDHFKSLATKFDSIYAKETQIFGSNIPTRFYSNFISSNACRRRVNLLVYDINGDAREGYYYGTFGYFPSFKDFLEREYESTNKDLHCESSNLAECLYLDSYLLYAQTTQVHSTAAHEFQHLLNYVNKWINKNIENSTWSNEMLSMIAEEIFQDSLEVSDSDSPKNRYPHYQINSPMGFTVASWKKVSDDNKSGIYEYANAYAYGSLLLHSFGIPFVNSVMTSSYVDAEAISNALNSKYGFYTVFFNLGKTYVNGKLPAISTSGYEIREVNIHDFMTASKTSAENAYNLTSEKIENYYPVILKNNYYPSKLYPEGFFVNDLGTVEDSGSTFSIPTITPDSNIYRFVYVTDKVSEAQ